MWEAMTKVAGYKRDLYIQLFKKKKEKKKAIFVPLEKKQKTGLFPLGGPSQKVLIMTLRWELTRDDFHSCHDTRRQGG